MIDGDCGQSQLSGHLHSYLYARWLVISHTDAHTESGSITLLHYGFFFFHPLMSFAFLLSQQFANNASLNPLLNVKTVICTATVPVVYSSSGEAKDSEDESGTQPFKTTAGDHLTGILERGYTQPLHPELLQSWSNSAHLLEPCQGCSNHSASACKSSAGWVNKVGGFA